VIVIGHADQGKYGWFVWSSCSQFVGSVRCADALVRRRSPRACERVFGALCSVYFIHTHTCTYTGGSRKRVLILCIYAEHIRVSVSVLQYVRET